MTGGLLLRGVQVVSPAELATLREGVDAEDLETSATLRLWFSGETVTPHSAQVALEAVLHFLPPGSEEVQELLVEVIDRIAECFPEDAQPL
jgi:hypothetical protein